MRPLSAYVEDVPEEGGNAVVATTTQVAAVDVPPKAPSPPPTPAPITTATTAMEPSPATAAENINVFDFLVTEPQDTPTATTAAAAAAVEALTPLPYKTVERAPSRTRSRNRNSQTPASASYATAEWSQTSSQGPVEYLSHGFSYGATPVPPSNVKYDSWQNLNDSQSQSQSQGAFVTPAPKESKRVKKVQVISAEKDASEKKRKRHQLEDLDLSGSASGSGANSRRPSSSRGQGHQNQDLIMSDAPPASAKDDRVLHSGLTGGLSRLVTDREFLDDRIGAGPTPVRSPVKKSRRAEEFEGQKRGDEREREKDRPKSSYASYSIVKIRAGERNGNEQQDGEGKYHEDKSRRRARSPDREHERERDQDRRGRDSRPPVEDRRYRDRADRLHDDDRRRDSISSDNNRPPRRKLLKVIEYPAPNNGSGNGRTSRPGSVQPTASNQIINHPSSGQHTNGSTGRTTGVGTLVGISENWRASLFLSLITKGPESERGCSINKVLKRYHRERDIRAEGEHREGRDGRDSEGRDGGGGPSKELWKGLRLRRNSRGEVVLFT